MSNPLQREIRTVSTEFRVATAEDGTRTLTGLIPYNSQSVDMGFIEMIAPGAFAGALREDSDCLCLRDHDPAYLLGRVKSKTLTLTDSPEGLRFNCKLPNTTQANDLVESINRGDLDSNSFGFTCLEDKWTSDGQGNVLRTLLEVELFEVSAVSFAAYPASQVAVRSCPAEFRSLIKTKTEKRSEENDDADPNDNGCQCTCDPCRNDDCLSCETEDCTDPQCLLNQDEDRSANLKLAIEIALASL